MIHFSRLIAQHIFWRGLYYFSIFLINIIISRYFKAEGSGWIFYIINNLSFLLLLTSLSLEAGAGFYSSAAEISPQKVATLCLLWAILSTIICTFVVNGFSLDFKPWVSSRLEFIVGTSAYILGVLLTSYFTALFFAKQDFRAPNLILFIVNLVLIGFIFFAKRDAWFTNHFVTIYFFSFLLQGLLVFLAYHIRYVNRDYLSFPSWQMAKKILRYSSLALFANVIFFLVYRVDYWLVKNFCSYNDLGNYIQVSKLGQLLILIPSIMASTIFPLVAGGRAEEMARGLTIVTRLLLFGIASVCICLVIAGRWGFPWLFGNSFDKMDFLFLLLIPGILALTAHYPLTAYFAGKKKFGTNIRGSLIGLSVIVIGDLIFIPILGVKAAAIFSSIGYFTYYLYVLFIFRREYEGKITDFFIIKSSDWKWLVKTLSTQKPVNV